MEWSYHTDQRLYTITGVDLSQILGRQPKYWGGATKILGAKGGKNWWNYRRINGRARARAVSQVYAYVYYSHQFLLGREVGPIVRKI